LLDPTVSAVSSDLAGEGGETCTAGCVTYPSFLAGDNNSSVLDGCEPSNGVTVTTGGLEEAMDTNLLLAVGLRVEDCFIVIDAGLGAIGTYLLLLLLLGLSAEPVENNCLLTLDGTGDE